MWRISTLFAVLALLISCSGSTSGPVRDATLEATVKDGPRNPTSDGSVQDSTPQDANSVNDATVPKDGAPPSSGALVYVTVGGDNRLAVVEMSSDGTLRERAEASLALAGSPGAMTRDPTTGDLYIGLGDGRVETVTVDAQGNPAAKGTSDVTDRPVFLSVSPDRKTLVAAYFGADRLRTFALAGAPPHFETDELATAVQPHAARFGANGLLYVPHRDGQVTHWYTVSDAGKLTKQGELAGPQGAGPRHIAFSADGASAYIANEHSLSVSSHRVLQDGALERFETLSTLPSNTDPSGMSCADVHITPDGKFVYVSNRGHDSIARFAVKQDGGLAFLGTTPTEARPREFDIAPDGTWLLVAGQDSGFLANYRIEQNGDLSLTDRLELGADLRWAVAVQ